VLVIGSYLIGSMLNLFVSRFVRFHFKKYGYDLSHMWSESAYTYSFSSIC
jgi:hypothetical protein